MFNIKTISLSSYLFTGYGFFKNNSVWDQLHYSFCKPLRLVKKTNWLKEQFAHKSKCLQSSSSGSLLEPCISTITISITLKINSLVFLDGGNPDYPRGAPFMSTNLQWTRWVVKLYFSEQVPVWMSIIWNQKYWIEEVGMVLTDFL